MSARSIRRAAERKLAKLARKAARNNQPQNAQPLVVAAAANAEEAQAEFSLQETNTMRTTSTPHAMALAAGAGAGAAATVEPVVPSVEISEARLNANRANAQLSTGPRTSAGKSKASLNAIKTGLTGQTVVLPSEDAKAYQDHVARIIAKYKPAAADEEMLTQAIADHEWRLARIPALEASIHAIGLREFSSEFEDEADPENRKALIRGKVMLHYRKDLTNLAIQERRLRNHREKDIDELRQLQSQRKERRQVQISSARQLLQNNDSLDLTEVGFDFTNQELETFKLRAKTIYCMTGVPADFDLFLEEHRNKQKAA